MHSAFKQADLSGVMRFVLADMEPFTEVVSRSPSPALIYCHEPGVVALPEFGKCFFTALMQQVEIVIEAVTFDRLAGRFAKFHRYGPVPESRDFVEGVRRYILERIQLIQLLGR